MRVALFSRIYVFIRRLLPRLFPSDYETIILWGHQVFKHLGPFQKWITKFSIPPHLETSLYTLKFPSPLILAAFEGDFEMVNIWSDFGLGGATLKTILQAPRSGNPRPRIYPVLTPEGEGLINAMGLPGMGLSRLIDSLDDLSRFSPLKPLGFSIGGNSIEEYTNNAITLLEALSTHKDWNARPYFIEINISCPNTPEGQDMLTHPGLLTDLLSTLKTRFPSVVMGPKLSPDQSNDSLLAFGRLVAPFPNTYINLGNSQYRKFGKISGGLTGPALFKRTLQMIHLLAPLRLPLIATGGVSNTAQVQQLLDAGATLVGMATSVVQNPYTIPTILSELSSLKKIRVNNPYYNKYN